MTSWEVRFFLEKRGYNAVEANITSPERLARGMHDYADAIEEALDEGHEGADAVERALELLSDQAHL